MKTLGVIPARGGSKGIPRKNISDLLGRPLLVWSLEAVQTSHLARTIVSTDDSEIAETAARWGAIVPFLRPHELASDSAGPIPVLQHAVEFFEDRGEQFDAIMMLQPTSPMRLTKDIDGAIEKMERDPAATSVISVVAAEEKHPARMKYLRDGILVDPPFCESRENQPRQELEPMYLRNGSIYLVRRDTLMMEASLKGSRCLAQIISPRRSVNVDSPFDFEMASWLMSNKSWRDW